MPTCTFHVGVVWPVTVCESVLIVPAQETLKRISSVLIEQVAMGRSIRYMT